MSDYRITLGFDPRAFLREPAALQLIIRPAGKPRRSRLEYMRQRRAAWVAAGLTTKGKPRKRKPSKWPLLSKLDHAAFVRNWRYERFVSRGLTTEGKRRLTKEESNAHHRVPKYKYWAKKQAVLNLK